MTRTSLVWIVVVLIGASVAAQQPRPQFEVASVKPAGVQRPRPLGELTEALPRVRPGGRFSGTPITVEGLLTFAYDLKPIRVVGGPEWIRRDWFEINAIAGNEVHTDQLRLMMRSLLEDRFKLVAHVEQREMRFLALGRVRPDGPLGPGLSSIDECSGTRVSELRRKFPERYPFPMNGTMGACSREGMNGLADILSSRLATPVIDETALQGDFYVTLRSQLSMPPASALGAARIDSDIPALSTALDEQLGLKLESRRGPIDVLVIDSVEQPTAD